MTQSPDGHPDPTNPATQTSPEQEAADTPLPPAPAEVDLEAELAQADSLLEAALAQPAPAAKPADAEQPDTQAPQEIHHDIRRGRISAIRGEDVFVEITGESKLQGVVPLQQFERAPRVGSIMDFVVDHIEEDQGLVYLSREGAISRATWDQLVKGTVVEARVTGTNKGGLELELIGNIRAFMPASQVDMHHVDELEPLVGQKLEAMVQEIDRKGRKVLLSRRAHLEIQRKRNREKLLKELEVGQVREGTVSNLMDFGAFVDLGGIDGLVHVTDLAYTHVNHPKDVVKPGDKVQVKVLRIEKEKDRISLGIKQVGPSPWEAVDGAIKPGDTIEAKIVRTASFGAFVEVKGGVEALLPLSEMGWKRVHRAEEVVQVGQTLRMAVLTVDAAKQRMTVSLKAATEDPWTGAERKYAVDTQHEGKVVSITDFGAFVELEAGLEGLVHISELSDKRVGTVGDILKLGDIKSFRIKEVDEDNRKLSLSLKDKPAAAQHAQASPSVDTNRPRPSLKRPSNLKSGLGTTGAMGMGLGGLRLEDIK